MSVLLPSAAIRSRVGERSAGRPDHRPGTRDGHGGISLRQAFALPRPRLRNDAGRVHEKGALVLAAGSHLHVRGRAHRTVLGLTGAQSRVAPARDASALEARLSKKPPRARAFGARDSEALGLVGRGGLWRAQDLSEMRERPRVAGADRGLFRVKNRSDLSGRVAQDESEHDHRSLVDVELSQGVDERLGVLGQPYRRPRSSEFLAKRLCSRLGLEQGQRAVDDDAVQPRCKWPVPVESIEVAKDPLECVLHCVVGHARVAGQRIRSAPRGRDIAAREFPRRLAVSPPGALDEVAVGAHTARRYTYGRRKKCPCIARIGAAGSTSRRGVSRASRFLQMAGDSEGTPRSRWPATVLAVHVYQPVKECRRPLGAAPVSFRGVGR